MFYGERELETEHNGNILTPTLMAVSVCLSRSPGLLNWRPRGPLSWVMAFFTASYQQLLWTPTLPGFSTTSCLLTRLISSCLTFVLTELYNSSTPTQSPTRYLEWHVWSSSSRNNCHAVHRSLSSGVSVYGCTIGILVSQFPPTRFLLITAIGMCHFLQVHHLGIAFLAGSKVKIQQYHIIQR